MNTPETVLVGLAIAVGLVGVLVPVLPGALLVLGSILVWAIIEGSTTAWVVFALGTVAIAASQVVKYVMPTRRLREAGIPTTSLMVGGGLGFVGFFVIPVVGLFVGFPLGVYVAERRRLGASAAALASTRAALKAVGLSVLIELVGAMLAAGGWLAAVLVG